MDDGQNMHIMFDKTLLFRCDDKVHDHANNCENPEDTAETHPTCVVIVMDGDVSIAHRIRDDLECCEMPRVECVHVWTFHACNTHHKLSHKNFHLSFVEVCLNPFDENFSWSIPRNPMRAIQCE